MLMTPEEARTKRCVNHRYCTCIADGCMGWRWIRIKTGVSFQVGKDGIVNGKTCLYEDSETLGYCGLAVEMK